MRVSVVWHRFSAPFIYYMYRFTFGASPSSNYHFTSVLSCLSCVHVPQMTTKFWVQVIAIAQCNDILCGLTSISPSFMFISLPFLFIFASLQEGTDLLFLI